MIFRDFEDDDAEAAAAVLRAAMPVEVHTAPGLRHWLRTRSPAARPRAWVAESAGAIVGWGFAQTPGPTAWFWAGVRPDARRRGAGAALFAACRAHAAALGATSLQSVTVGDPAGEAFLERRGFARGGAEVYQRLDLAAPPEPAPPEGARVLRLREAGASDVHGLVAAVLPDAPPFEAWRRKVLEHPELSAEASAVVLVGDRVASVALLRVDYERGLAQAQWTATAPDLRQRGLARAAKAASARWAFEVGVRSILTSNAAEEEPVLALNRALGYREVARAFAWDRGVGDKDTRAGT